MTPRLSPRQKKLYCLALANKTKLVGFGRRPGEHLYAWQRRLPLEAIVESNALAFQAGESDTPCGIIPYYTSPQAWAMVEKIKGASLLSPLPLQHVLRETAARQAQSKMTAKRVASLVTLLDPLISTDSTLPTKEQSEALSSYDWPDFVGQALRMLPKDATNKKRVVLACNSLASGGAERQIVTCAIGFKQAGWTPSFLATMNEIAAPHYLKTLRDAKIPVTFAMKNSRFRNAPFTKRFVKGLTPLQRAILWHLPTEIAAQVASAMLYLQKEKPHLVIAYLDWSNLIAALAALMVGVPEVIISGRNYAPGAFPHFFKNVLRIFYDLYHVLMKCPNVHFTNNAKEARDDYARWLGVDPSQIAYVPNALSPLFLERRKREELDRLRKSLAIDGKTKIILGVFRLEPEKRPEKFIDIIAGLRKNEHKVRAFICGDGPMKDDLVRHAAKLGIAKDVTFLGNTNAVREVMNLADLMIHTCPKEGMPNAVLEAQSQGLPILCLRSGGMKECLAPELLPYCLKGEDWAGLQRKAESLLTDAAKRSQLGRAARLYVTKKFTVAALVKRNLDLLR